LGQRRSIVVPVELAQIKQEGDKVTGVISSFHTPNGQCEANETPFVGTYAGGVLSIKSMRLESKKADGGSCGPMFIEATYSNGGLAGTYRIGERGPRIDVYFPLK
jgi:hypothetical protein